MLTRRYRNLVFSILAASAAILLILVSQSSAQDGAFATIYQADKGVTLSFLPDANLPEQVVWQAWIEDDSELYVFDFTGIPNPSAANDFLIPSSVLDQVGGRGPVVVQAVQPGAGKIAEIRVNQDEILPPEAPPSVMVAIGMRGNQAWANFVAVDADGIPGSDSFMIPIDSFSFEVSDELLGRLTRIEAKLDAMTDTEPQQSNVTINTATLAELKTIPGIGEVKAGAIVAERGTPGLVGYDPFDSWQDLMNRVKGIGPTTVADMRAAGVELGSPSNNEPLP